MIFSGSSRLFRMLFRLDFATRENLSKRFMFNAVVVPVAAVGYLIADAVVFVVAVVGETVKASIEVEEVDDDEDDDAATRTMQRAAGLSHEKRAILLMIDELISFCCR